MHNSGIRIIKKVFLIRLVAHRVRANHNQNNNFCTVFVAPNLVYKRLITCELVITECTDVFVGIVPTNTIL